MLPDSAMLATEKCVLLPFKFGKRNILLVAADWQLCDFGQYQPPLL